MRELSSLEFANASFLSQNDVPFGMLEVTKTGLEKSILDATQSFREFLQEFAIHDYDRQPQGPDFKTTLTAHFVDHSGAQFESKASLYRPVSKNGDPRIWFRDLKNFILPGAVLAAIWTNNRFWLVDLAAVRVESLAHTDGPLREQLSPFVHAKTNVVETLLGKLREVAGRGYLPAPVAGSTAVGRLLESELGIEINSRRDPDFHGIEIKSSRGTANRTSLFAKTPDWAASKYKSSRALLDAFGYDREGRRKLSCTISGLKPNSQQLQLEVDDASDRLHVIKAGENRHRAVRWDLDVLRHSLATKHNETFWVKAESKVVDGWEFIRFKEVQHTQRAIVAQLSPLLRDGKVTVDFLIREEGDKGYLFKLHPKNLALLFPAAVRYDLSSSDTIGGLPPLPPSTLF